MFHVEGIRVLFKFIPSYEELEVYIENWIEIYDMKKQINSALHLCWCKYEHMIMKNILRLQFYQNSTEL